MMDRKRRWAVMAVIAVGGVLLDWATKLLVLRTLQPGEIRPFLGDVFQWTLAFNPGSLAGFDPSRWIDGFPTQAFLGTVAVIEVVVLLWVYGRLDASRHRLALWGLALVVPGALGNLLDRILGRPGVVDFVRMDLGFPPFHPWPIYNVADIFITIAIGLILLDSLRSPPDRPADPATAKGPGRRSAGRGRAGRRTPA